ncbi:MAG: SUF system NifU family Fe-S cluster assembly protein [Legionellaceae bacterium]|nr:SUF system NifU family Fe-S cluster assembly protein [Legionellaceae bacterium]
MSLDLRELYQEIIIDHNRNPRNHYSMADASAQANGFNPLCGDKLTVYLKVQQDIVEAVSFVGCGCAISQASASLMTEALQGKTLQEAHDLFHSFHQLLTSDSAEPAGLNKLTVLVGVRAFPARVKCATLAWHTLEAALKQDAHPVSTE